VLACVWHVGLACSQGRRTSGAIAAHKPGLKRASASVEK